MEQHHINRLIEENMKTVYGFALTRMGNEQDAEELASDIIYALMRALPSLRDESRFYPFMWRIAERTYADRLRAKYKPTANTVVLDAPLGETLADDELPIQDELVLREELNLLRRELSLLSEQHRRVTVMYYMENFSCGEIARVLHISTETVKYYLFRAIKIIREGMNMERLFGEQSYRPHNFMIDFWGSRGGHSEHYRMFGERKILGNILTAAYYTPVTAQEISVMLGVTMPYLEDEMRTLMKYDYLVRRGDKYVTNIPVFTKDCSDRVATRADTMVKDAAARFASLDFGAFKARFCDRFPNENLLRWQVYMLCCHFALANTEGDLDAAHPTWPNNGVYHKIMHGAGVVWGRVVPTEEENLPAGRIWGIYNGNDHDDGSVIAFNFFENLEAQHYEGYERDSLMGISCGIQDTYPDKWRARLEDDGYLADGKPNYPVWTHEEFQEFRSLLSEGIDILTGLVRSIASTAAEINADLAPAHIRDQATYVGALVYRINGIGEAATALCDSGWIKPVTEKEKPTLCVVISK